MEKKNEQQTDEIVSSLEGCKRATAPDFFYTRLLARMEKNESQNTPWFWHPAFAFSVLLLLLLINLVVVFQSKENEAAASAADNDNIQAIATDYNLTESSSLYYVNADK
jgi:hypothetical protein